METEKEDIKKHKKSNTLLTPFQDSPPTGRKKESHFLPNRAVKWILPVIFIAITIAGYFLLDSVETGPRALPAEIRKPPGVDVCSVKFYDKPVELRLTGNVSALYKTEISSELTGNVISVSEKLVKGGFFKKGEEMLRIDNRDYQDDLVQFRAALAKVKLEVARERELARQALEDWQELGQGTPTDLALRKPQTEQALASLAAAQSQLQRAERNLEKTTIKAPFDCMVASRSVSAGTFVTAGAPLFEIYNTDMAEIRLAVSSEDSAFLNLPDPGAFLNKTGKVEIISSGGGSTVKREGYLSRIEGETDPETRLQYLVVRVEDPYSVRHRLPLLKIGDFVEVRVAGKTFAHSAFIPESALLDDNRIIKVDDNNKISFAKIDIVRRFDDNVLISGNLEENEKIVISRLEFPVEGTLVRINGKESERK